MIYLIGGAPRLGKSSVAKELMKKLSVPWESTDTIRSAVYQAMDPATRDARLPFANVQDHIEVFKRPTDTLIEEHYTEAKSLAASIEAYAGDHVMTDEPLILEGLHLTPGLVKQLQTSDKFHNQTKTLFITVTDKEMLLAGIKASMGHHDWLRGKPADTLTAAVEFIFQFSESLQSEALNEGYEIIERTNDFSKDIKKAVSLLSDK
ncbi:hypothetical protein EXS54_03025 [Patescibacteria group bacterium]|nr:hypothetical protein [Patescibacteria group bacterium]